MFLLFLSVKDWVALFTENLYYGITDKFGNKNRNESTWKEEVLSFCHWHKSLEWGVSQYFDFFM